MVYWLLFLFNDIMHTNETYMLMLLTYQNLKSIKIYLE